MGASTPSWALLAGFTGGPPAATLGQPLDFTVGVRLEGGEALTPECVAAEVTFGERRLMPGQFRVSLEAVTADSTRIRVASVGAVDEPLVAVQVNAGCGSRLSRRFVLLADPPALGPSPTVMPMMALANVSEAVAGAPGRAAQPAPEAASADPAPRAAAEAAARPVPPRAAAKPVRAVPVSLPARAEGLPEGVRAAARVARPRPSVAPVALAAAKVAAAAPAARLKLEPPEPTPSRGASETESNRIIEDAIEAVAAAASAAKASAAAASASAERIATLERTVARLQAEAKANQAFVTESRDRMQRAEDAARWTWPLAALVLVLGGAAAWLGLRLRKAQTEREIQWRTVAPPPAPAEGQAAKQPTAHVPFVTAAVTQPAATNPGTRPYEGASAAERWSPATDILDTVTATAPLVAPSPPEPRESPVQRTDILPPRVSVDEGHARDVSIEELIDLEQQAEFFVVLGQDDAAVDLLNEHLRQTGGGSPLPYLKLLEIHRRRGDHADYESMRQRFNLHFNAYAPDWDADMLGGRSLEDYPGVIPRLQQVWPRPMDTMAELEALLFRKSRGELFDLPAYREVLFLYALARDLLDRESAGTGDVDLLLPLSSGNVFGTTSPAPFMGLGESDIAPVDGGTVDFDLSVEADRQTSIFDTLEDPPPPSRRP